ncbi:MAG: hypothetical protein ACI4SL_00945 [Candidatus Ornithospirochaeta sp.]
MGEIIPRWEWRTFGKEFGVGEERIKAHELGTFKKSSEKYILSRNSNENCKIRDDLMDIKSLRQVNEDKLEQWYPTMKQSFPMKKEVIEDLFKNYFKVEVPVFERDEYTYDQYLEELVGKNPDLVIVNVYKERSIYTIEGTTVEIAETTFNGVVNRTICVEHIDPALVMKVVRDLGVEGYPNINYLKAMKMAVGMEK